MPAKNNPKPLTAKAFNNVKLDDLKAFYDLIFNELNLTRQPIKLSDIKFKKTYYERLLPILNSNMYYFHEGNVINEKNIRHFIDRVKNSGFINPMNNVNRDGGFMFIPEDTNESQNKIELVDPGLQEMISNLIIEEEEEEKELPINTNQGNQNNFLFSKQSQSMNQSQINKRNSLMAAINRFNEVSIRPILQNELTGDTYLDTELLINRMHELQTRHVGNGKASSKIGMGELAKIVLDLQRDIKRVSKAISPRGASEMVDKHNQGLPEDSASRWKFVHRDVNGDNIPDVLITNSKNQPLFINGYTTKKSDYPIRYEFYNDFPTGDDRKQALQEFGSISKYAKNKFNVQYNDNFDGDLHKLGEMTSWQLPKSWQNYKLDNYKGFPTKKKDLSGFDRFKRYVLGDKFNDVIEVLKQRKICNIPGKYKIRVISKATAELWRYWILAKIAEAHNIRVDGEAMEKIKKTADGKKDINAVVSSLLNDLNLVNPEVDWTEEKRQALENQLYEEIAQAVVHFAEQIVPPEELHKLNDEDYNQPLFEEFPVESETHADKSHGEWNQDRHGTFNNYNLAHTPLRYGTE